MRRAGARWVRATVAGVVGAASALAVGTAPPATAHDAAPRVTGPDRLVAVPRDLGTGEGTSSASTALAGRVVVGLTSGVGTPGATRLFQYDLDTPSASMRPLDDQGVYPSLSTIADADGPVVVGRHQTGTSSSGAFVVDLRTQSATSLPRFGGLHGAATAVDGGVVVGAAEDADLHEHAFAYDAAGARAVLDLGTLGGPSSTASDVSGSVVVGQSDLSSGGPHAFVVDLAGPGRPMVDVGTLGGARSAATAVDGDVVVGWAEVFSGTRQAFAARRTQLPGPLRDLGTLGGATAEATDVSGNVVVGVSARADGSTGIWWADLAASPVVLHDLGTQAVGQPAPRVVGSRVVGTRRTAAGDRGFVHDLGTGKTVELDPLAGHQRTSAVDVSGDVVAGTSYGDGSSHAVAWTLSTVAAPSIGLRRHRTRATEGTRARIGVVRTGDLREAVTIRYRIRGVRGGARPGKDFRGGRGTVVLGPGQTRAVIRPWIRDDRLPEGRERARIRLEVVRPDGSVSVPRRGKGYLVIRRSDR